MKHVFSNIYITETFGGILNKSIVLLTKMHVIVVLHHSDIQHSGILRAVTAICLPDRSQFVTIGFGDS